MKRFVLAAALAVMLGSQADAQVIISAGGYQPAGIYTPLGGITTSSYYSSGYYSPYTTYGSYYTPAYSSYYTPAWSSGYYYPSTYSTGYYNSYRPAYGMYRGRGWRW